MEQYTAILISDADLYEKQKWHKKSGFNMINMVWKILYYYSFLKTLLYFYKKVIKTIYIC